MSLAEAQADSQDQIIVPSIDSGEGDPNTLPLDTIAELAGEDLPDQSYVAQKGEVWLDYTVVTIEFKRLVRARRDTFNFIGAAFAGVAIILESVVEVTVLFISLCNINF